MQLRTIAIRAVKVPVGPKLSCDASALAVALVTVEALLRKRDLHRRIRSFSLASQKRPPKGGRHITKANFSLCEKNLRLGFDDEEGVGLWMTCGAELLLRLVESVRDGGEDDAAIVAADKIEMALLLNEF
jgi:hypothetical protein